MNRADLIAMHPTLWHMADPVNKDAILKRGLLSTSALLDLFEITGEERLAIESGHRPDSVTIRHAVHGSAVIRDQKPMSLEGLTRSVTDATPQDYLKFLNGRVFFWLTEERLKGMTSARAYREHEQLVLKIDTAALVNTHENRILLSPRNSGATKPFAWERSIEMFKRIADYDYAARAQATDPIVELTVDHSVPDVMSLVETLEIWKNGKRVRKVRYN